MGKKQLPPSPGVPVYKSYRPFLSAEYKVYVKAKKGIPITDNLYHVNFTFHQSECKQYWRCESCQFVILKEKEVHFEG